MSALHVKRLDDNGDIVWALYEEGEFLKPLILIHDFEFEKLLAERDQQLEEETNDDEGLRL
jgi:hypothetical protein